MASLLLFNLGNGSWVTFLSSALAILGALTLFIALFGFLLELFAKLKKPDEIAEIMMAHRDAVTVKCPYCRGILRVPKINQHMTINCELCKKEVIVELGDTGSF